MREYGFSELINARRMLAKPLLELPLRNEQKLFYDTSRRLRRFAGHTTLAYNIIPDLERGKFRREECSPKTTNLRDYIEHKGNRNVSITGASGQGKSYLTMHLLRRFEDKQRIIFSFKPDDHEVHLGIPVIDAKQCLPNPFRDIDAFSEAYITAFFGEKVSSGIQLQQTPAFLQEIASQSNDWKSFMKKISEKRRSASKNQIETLNAIEQNVKSLVIEDMGNVELPNESTVFDFSTLPTKQAQNFYAELMLRQIYREMESRKRRDVLICIDEAHRLTKSYHTILDVMSREIRDKGMLWIITQNLIDILPEMRANFGTKFTFRLGDADLQMLSYNQLVRYSVSILQPRQFTDIEFPESQAFTPVMTYIPDGNEHKETQKIRAKVNETRIEEKAGGRGKDINFREEVLRILGERMSYATEMGKEISAKYGINKDQAKLKIKSVLEELKNSDQVGRVKYLKDGKPIVMYYSRSPNLSNLHTGMQSQAVDILTELGASINRISTTGERGAFDIETDFFMVEIETGLKHSMEDLKARIAGTNLRVIIIVPNKELIDKYQQLGERVMVMTMDSLKEMLLDMEKTKL
ncbi:MAG: AAA family ATPase [Nitrososphaerota archaeon]|uniref:AAA family ATPase n=1 Tax=Acidiplasma sp. TaxID=1872114 RepID=UPI003169871F